MTRATITHLVYGGTRQAREQAISAQALNAAPGMTLAAIVEGLALPGAALESSGSLKVIRIAPACPCCTGSLTMSVTLNRVLRKSPAVLFLGLSDASHLASIRRFLQQEQYCGRLQLGPDVDCEPVSQSQAG